MKTITFYSYKGGVGRTLALSNVAIRLAELGKNVCVLDFDLEAPGLNFKFKNYRLVTPISKGIVDYIFQFTNENKIGNSILEFATHLVPNKTYSKSICFIPAGNTESSEYWRKLSSINWSDLFYSENARGVQFFLDIKAKIESELKPDVLLIDSRTGITDISGITLKIFADDIVIMGANNDENMWGSKKLIKTLLDPTTSLFDKAPEKLIFVLTRIPSPQSPDDIPRISALVDKRKREMKGLLKDESDFLSIRSDSRLEEQEQMLIGDEIDEKNESIANDYLKFFEKLTIDILSPEEIKNFQNKKKAELEATKAWAEKNIPKRIEYLNKAIELIPNEVSYYISRGFANSLIGKLDEAYADNIKAIELDPLNAVPFYNIGIINFLRGQEKEALENFDKSLKIAPHYELPYLQKALILKKNGKKEEALTLLDNLLEHAPDSFKALNTKADINRELGRYEEAKADIYKAISINSNQRILYGTLAEIKASEGDIEEFYLNLSIALNKGIRADELKSAKDVYMKFKDDKRLIELLSKYNIDIEEVLKED